MIVYKVCSDIAGRHFSVLGLPSRLKYKAMSVTRMNKRLGYLYAFKSIDSARAFGLWNYSNIDNYVIYTSIAKVVDEEPICEYYCTTLESFWSKWRNGTLKRGNTRPAPEGTVWCEWIMPLWLVKNERS